MSDTEIQLLPCPLAVVENAEGTWDILVEGCLTHPRLTQWTKGSADEAVRLIHEAYTRVKGCPGCKETIKQAAEIADEYDPQIGDQIRQLAYYPDQEAEGDGAPFTVELSKDTELRVGSAIGLNCPDDLTRLHKVIAVRDKGDYYEVDVELLLKGSIEVKQADGGVGPALPVSEVESGANCIALVEAARKISVKLDSPDAVVTGIDAAELREALEPFKDKNSG